MVVHCGDNREVLALELDDTFDAVVTDPPYELSDDGKASASRVFSELVFPEDPKIQTEESAGCQLAFLVGKVLGLGVGGPVPCPPPPVPVCTVTLDNDAPTGDHNIKDVLESADRRSDGDAGVDSEPKPDEHLGCFLLKAADPSSALEAFNRVGTGFDSGRLRIGFRIDPSGLPGLLAGSGPVEFGNHDIGSIDDSFSVAVGALLGTEDLAVPSLSLARCPQDNLTASAALVFLAALKQAGSVAVRADPGASRFSSKLQTRRIRVIGGPANRTLTFDLVLHPQNIASKGFMGKEWDGSKIAFDVGLWAELLRVAKPGVHLLAFGGTRLWHRMAVAIEDAGWEIRDSLMWLYGSGFPKSLDIAKAIDKDEGHWRGRAGGVLSQNTLDAQRWSGWGTALKPAWEPIILARKPLIGTVAANVLEHGTGGLNIDGCRVGDDPAGWGGGAAGRNSGSEWRDQSGLGKQGAPRPVVGRFPANLILDEEAGAVLDAEAGDRPGQQARSTGVKTGNVVFGAMQGRSGPEPRQDSGGPSRFFYCAKASVTDREEGLEHLPKSALGEMVEREPESAGTESPRAGAGRKAAGRANIHPTVKPTELMRYLCRLITPPGGTILDPFCGSGSTGKAAALEGFRFYGIDMDPKYAEIARARIAWAEANRG